MSGKRIDVSELPTFAFGNRSVMWWGTLCVMFIEGSMFLFAIISYFYLQGTQYEWPPGAVRHPGLGFALANTAVLAASIWPNQRLKKAAETLDERKARRILPLMSALALVFLVIRAFEFTQLHIRWDHNAYGSILWTLLGLHTVHLVTDAYDTIVLTAMMFAPPIEGRRFVDVAENCLYWDFVVGAWVPILFVVYLLPRM